MSEGLEETDFSQTLREFQAKHEAWAQTPEGRAQLAAAALADEEARRQVERDERERPYRRLSDCGVPRRVVDVLRSHQPTAAVSRVTRWVDERATDPSSWCLVLSADKGLGKSVAAGLWLLRAEPSSPTFVGKAGTVERLPAWWPISRFARVEGYDGKFDALCNHPGPVVLDDLGSEYLDGKGWFLQALDAFVDARYAEYRPTLITTNLTADQFKARYSERVADRLREGGSFYEFRGASMRRASA